MATDEARIRVRPGYRPNFLSIFGAVLVTFLVVWLVVNFIKSPSEFYGLFLIGLTNGAVYGLVALGYSLVYGILELINFAHGDVFMLGGMLVATMTTAWLTTASRGRAVVGDPGHAPDHDGFLRDDQHDDRDRRLPRDCEMRRGWLR